MSKHEDLTGQKFGKLTARKYLGKSKWLCDCDCGGTAEVLAYNLKNGNSKSCGCTNKERLPLLTLNDISGQTFGNVEVVKRIGSQKGHSVFLCKCLACGKNFTCLGTSLISENQVSCGCIGRSNRRKGREKTNNESKLTGTNIGKIKSDSPNRNNTTTGIKGVCYIKSTRMYVAYIGFQKKRYELARSRDINVCIMARKEAEKELYGDFLAWYEQYKKSRDETL